MYFYVLIHALCVSVHFRAICKCYYNYQKLIKGVSEDILLSLRQIVIETTSLGAPLCLHYGESKFSLYMQALRLVCEYLLCRHTPFKIKTLVDAQISVFRYPIFPPGSYFRSQFLVSLIVFFDALNFFPPNHTLPVNWVAGSLFVPPCCTPVFFTAPLWAGFFWGLCSSAALSLVAPQSSPTSGRSLWCRLVRSVSGGPPFLTLFCTAWLTALGELPLISPVSLFVHFLHIRGPSIVSSFGCRDTGTACTTASLMGPFGYRKLGNLTYHRLLEVLSVYMLIEA